MGHVQYDPGHIDLDKDVGLNLYVWIAEPPRSNLAGIRAGMHVLHDAGTQAQVNKGSESGGYVLQDEIDMVQANAAGAAAARTHDLELHRGGNSVQ